MYIGQVLHHDELLHLWRVLPEQLPGVPTTGAAGCGHDGSGAVAGLQGGRLHHNTRLWRSNRRSRGDHGLGRLAQRHHDASRCM